MSGERTGFRTDLFKVPESWRHKPASPQLVLF
jgi:hypothetical protein